MRARIRERHEVRGTAPATTLFPPFTVSHNYHTLTVKYKQINDIVLHKYSNKECRDISDKKSYRPKRRNKDVNSNIYLY